MVLTANSDEVPTRSIFPRDMVGPEPKTFAILEHHLSLSTMREKPFEILMRCRETYYMMWATHKRISFDSRIRESLSGNEK